MIIEKRIASHIVFAEDSLLNALQKISENRSRLVFTVCESGRLEGVMTDGDFRRWIVTQERVDLNQPVSLVSNKRLVRASIHAPREQIAALFGDHAPLIPLVDDQGHLVAIARPGPDGVFLGDRLLTPQSPAFLIAEVGNNHNGSVELGKRLIDRAVAAGADCVKFQMRTLATLYSNQGNPDDAREDLGSQYTLDLLSRFNLDEGSLFRLFDHCRARGVMPLCTPWDVESVAALERYGLEAYKVASADLTNHDLLRAVAATGKPMLVSTGMSREAEIVEAVTLLQRLGAPYILLHCNATYPAPFKDVNLVYMDRLRELGDCLVGYSGHERGYHIALAAVARGAKAVEKHVTLDRAMEGNDHKVSLQPEEFRAMVEGIRQVEEALGSAEERHLSQGELINREVLAKSLVVNRPVAAGEVITASMLAVRSPGKGLQPNQRHRLLGRPTPRAMRAWECFYPSDLEERRVLPRAYRFRRPWGIPVRFHDHRALLARTNPDLLEFHLSYKDLEERLETWFEQPLTQTLVVHSPELFAGDHIMDLAAPDPAHRRRSLEELARVVAMTRGLKAYFPHTPRPVIITNVGGFTSDGFLPAEDRRELYDQVAAGLATLDLDGVEVIPQTMPPLPWHFGGQRYHNLFMDPGEIAAWCRGHGYRVCLDVSHSKLACNHFRWSFQEFVEQVAPHAAHLHIVDARGVDGEGLQIGDGEVDFPALARQLDALAPEAGFIPEIWQGHKNDGEGLWLALERLERWF